MSNDHDVERQTPLWCAEGTFMAAVDEDIVILDVNGDAYHCLLSATDLIELGFGGRIVVADSELAADLLMSGLVQISSPNLTLSTPEPASRELPLSPTPPLAEMIRVGVAWTFAAALFRKKSLRELIDFYIRAGPADSHMSEAHLSAITAAARHARVWIPGEGECLKRSFQLRCVLAGRGVRTDWIFGVRTWPFSAHCWLQIGDLVVGDRLARVRRYVPIMRV